MWSIATATPHIFLSLQRSLYLLFLSFQIVLLLIQIIALFTKFFHAFQLRPHSFPAIRLYLFIFPGQITDCIIVLLYLFRQTYPVYQILHFLIRFVKVCICHNFSTQPYHNFLFHIRHIQSILTFLSAHFKGTFRAFICPFCLF